MALNLTLISKDLLIILKLFFLHLLAYGYILLDCSYIDTDINLISTIIHFERIYDHQYRISSLLLLWNCKYLCI